MSENEKQLTKRQCVFCQTKLEPTYTYSEFKPGIPGSGYKTAQQLSGYVCPKDGLIYSKYTEG